MPGATIALVDDDRNILTSVTMALEAEGYQVRAYEDGEAASEDGVVEVPMAFETLLASESVTGVW